MMHRKTNSLESWLLRGACASALAALGSGVAAAQDPTGSDQGQTSSEPEQRRVETGQAGNENEQHILITGARLRLENIQDVPLSITQISGDEIANVGIGDVREIDGLVPNMVQTGLDSNVTPTIFIRGIGSDARNIGFESGVSLYVNGVYSGRPFAWMTELIDVEGVEVLRGPQGTLFGKNTIAGAISIRLRRPGDELRSTVEVEAGNYDLVRARGSVSGPLTEGVSAGLSAFRTVRDGFQTNLFNGADYWNKNDWGGRAQLRFRPTSNLDILIEGDLLKERTRMNQSTVVSGLGSTAAFGPRFVNINSPAFTDREVYGFDGTAELELGNGGTITSITAQRYNNLEFLSDDDNSPAPLLFSNFVDEERQFTQELRYTSPSDARLRYVVGAYYFRQRVRTDRVSISPAGGFAPVPLTVALQAEVNARDYAGYAQADFDVTDTLTLTAGLRYTHIDKDVVADLQGLPPFGIISFVNNREEQSTDALSPTASLLYRISHAINVYATFSRGFKGGGFNADFVSNPNLSFDPEYANNYEAGIKIDALDHRLRANLAAFHMDYTDLQVSVLSPIGGFIIDNAARATINGAELDVAARPFTGLTLTGGLGYTDATFDEYGANTGNRLSFAPRWTASAAAEYEFRLGNAGSLALRGEYNYRSSYFVDVSNAPNRLVEGYGLLNARATLSTPDNHVRVQAWGENLTNKLYITDRGAPLGGLLGSQNVVYGRPRTYGVRVIMSF